MPSEAVAQNRVNSLLAIADGIRKEDRGRVIPSALVEGGGEGVERVDDVVPVLVFGGRHGLLPWSGRLELSAAPTGASTGVGVRTLSTNSSMHSHARSGGRPPQRGC